jgi:hypothetical protein
MAKKDPPLKVEIPRPGAQEPAWSRVGIIGAAGFLIGIVWPKIAGVQIAPGVPEDLRAQPEVAAAAPAPSAAALAPALASSAPLAAPAAPSNQQLVVVGSGTISRCVDKKNKKVDECGTLQFDPIALPKLKELSKCPSALGLAGKLSIGFDIDFEKKEVHVVKGKKTSLPSSTVNGVLQCAAREFANISLEEVPHKYRRYTLFYTATFYPPGKHPEDIANAAADQAGDNDGEDAAGKTTSETEAAGTATVSWDTALVRKEPKDGEVVVRLLQGTKVKLVGRQNDWYKVEAGAKTGWIYRGAIGL